MPTDMSVEMTFVTGTSIIVASSDTVTNSVSFSVLLCLRSARASWLSFSWAASRFSLRYLAPFLFWVFEVRRAKVSLTWRATASSSTSSGLLLRPRFFFLRFPPPSAWPCCCCWPCFLPCWAGCWLAAALISTRSLLMRTRFFLPCPFFSSRSLRRSSLLFFFGRVFWLMVLRSSLPSTLSFGWLSSFFSFCVWKGAPPSVVAGSCSLSSFWAVSVWAAAAGCAFSLLAGLADFCSVSTALAAGLACSLFSF